MPTRDCSSRTKAPLLRVTAEEEESPLEMGLRFITIPAAELPDDVRLIEKIETAALIPVTQNPEVWSDRERIPPIAIHFGIVEEAQLEDLQGAGAALYQEGTPANEVGVYAICFADEAAAHAHWEMIVSVSTDAPYVQQGSWLLYVWKDDGVSSEAMEAVLEAVKTLR